MNDARKNNDSVDLDDLAYYFDAVAKDRYDQGQLGRRHGQVLALREKLLALPEFEFDAAIKTIEKLVSNAPKHTATIDTRQRYELQKQAENVIRASLMRRLRRRRR